MAEQIAEYLIIEPEFKLLISIPARVHKLWTGAAWAEGPVYFRDGDFLLFSDIPNNRMIRFVPDHTGLAGTGSVYRQPANNTNGHTRDLEGRLVSCEHGAGASRAPATTAASVARRQLQRQEAQLAQRRRGEVGRDRLVHRPGLRHPLRPRGLAGREGVWRLLRLPLRPQERQARRHGGQLRQAERHRVQPRREEALHRRHRRDPRRPTGRTTSASSTWPRTASSRGGEVFAVCDAGLFDGFRLDTDGRVWTSAGDGVHCYAPDGRCSARSWCPRSSPTSVSAATSVTASTSAARPRSTPSTPTSTAARCLKPSCERSTPSSSAAAPPARAVRGRYAGAGSTAWSSTGPSSRASSSAPAGSRPRRCGTWSSTQRSTRTAS